MKYKVTALQDVTLRASVPAVALKRAGGHLLSRPSEEEQWITLRAGQTRENLFLISGVHPSCLPGEKPTRLGGVSLVLYPGWSDDQLPMEFHGLYRLELQSTE